MKPAAILPTLPKWWQSVLYTTVTLIGILFSYHAHAITAAQSGNWNSTTTWTGGVVPTSTDPVIIAGGFTVNIDVNTAACLSLQLGNTGTGAGNGSLTFASNSQLSVNGALTIGTTGRTGSIDMTNGGILSCQSIVTTNLGAWTPGTGTLQLVGLSNLSGLTPFNNLDIKSAANTVTLGNTITVNGTLTLTSGTFALVANTLTMGTGSSIFRIDGNLTVSTGSVTGSHSVSYQPGASSYSTGPELNGTVTDISVSQTGASTLSVTLNSPLTINGTVTLTDGNFVAGTNLTMGAGSKINRVDGTMTGTIQGNNAYTVSYTGSDATTGAELSGTGSKSVTINMSPFTPTLTLSSDMTIGGTLTMTNGNIDLGSSTLTLGTSTSNPGAMSYTSGHIIQSSGTLTRWFNTSAISNGIFPLMVGGNDRSITLSGTPGAGGTISASATDLATNTTFGTSFTEGGKTFIDRNNSAWTLTTANGFTGSVNMQIKGDGIPGINDASGLTISSAAGAASGTYVASSGTTTAPVVSRNNVTLNTGANDFYIAGTFSNPLPVTFISFEVKKVDEGFQIEWQTASEHNNAGFEIQLSIDGNNWQDMAWVAGRGTSQEVNTYAYFLTNAPVSKMLYFRLKQIDYNGVAEYSSTQLIRSSTHVPVGIPGKLKLYPNPATTTVSVANLTSPIQRFDISDLSGRLILTGNQKTTDITTLPGGTYVVTIITQDENFTSILIK